MTRPLLIGASVAIAALASGTPALAHARSGSMTYRQKAAPIERRVDDLMRRLTPDEKASLLAGASSMTLHAIPRLGIPEIKVTDGPTGVRSPEGRPATVFPVGVAIAATWSPDIARKVGAAIAGETRGYGASVLLAPTVNIVRTPRWGRNFETYSEDPFLAGKLALGYIAGVQSKNIGVSLKHFAVNNQETNRFVVDSVIDERALREIYLPAFEMAVKQADPWSVMAPYNKINGIYASENRWLLTDLLKKEWGYKGFVVSDWGATHSTAAAANAGLDLEMPGPPKWFGDKLVAAVRAGEVSTAQLDDNARRIVRLIVRSGALDGAQPRGEIGGARHRATARAAAEEAIVLLKNAGMLPLRAGIKTLAVIGPNADIARIQGGGSSAVTPFDKLVTPLEAIRAALPGLSVVYEKGVDNEETPPAAAPGLFSPSAESSETGLQACYYASTDFSGTPVRSERVTDFTRRISANIASAAAVGYAAIRWSGVLRAPATGTYEFSVRGTGSGVLTLDGKAILDKATPVVPDNRDVIGFPVPNRVVSVALEAGKLYPIQLDYVIGQTVYEALKFGMRVPRPSFDAAIAAAKRADAAIVIAGSASLTEGEGYDRANIDLPGDQDELITAVAAANPATTVVINAGAAMTMPWADQVSGIVTMWLPGQEGAAALADILTGKVNPSGKLPVTFPRRSDDDLTLLTDLKTRYAEGLLVGYRGYEARGVAPLFAFGHGLSYTSFGYEGLVSPATTAPGVPVELRLSLRNTGKRAGKEVVQLYVARAGRTPDEPIKQLAAFAKVALKPGESRTVNLTAGPRAFAFWDAAKHQWVARAGAYQLLVGSASDDIRLRGEINVTTTQPIEQEFRPDG